MDDAIRRGDVRASLALPSGERIPLPGGFDPAELELAGNCRFVHADLLYAYDPTTGTGLAWCRNPAPHWQLIQPVTRAGFEEWAGGHSQMLSMQALANLLEGANSILDRIDRSKAAPSKG